MRMACGPVAMHVATESTVVLEPSTVGALIAQEELT